MITLTGTLSVESPEAVVTDLESAIPQSCVIQLFDARYVAGGAHLASAVGHANRAVDRGESVARDRSVEILLYAAGRRQIDDALEMGLGPGRHDVVGVVDGGPPDAAAETHRAGHTTPLAPEWIGPPTPAERDGARQIEDRCPLAVTRALGGGEPSVLAEYFGIGERERAATEAPLAALVRERVALLDIEK